jgi:hypothetical protein
MTKDELQEIHLYLDAYERHLKPSEYVPEVASVVRRVRELSRKAHDESDPNANQCPVRD